RRPRRAGRPRPAVAEPDRRQQLQPRRVRSAIDRGDPDQDVVGRGLRVLDEDVEVAVLVEDPGVEQLELRIGAAAPRRFRSQLRVGKRRLRILVERLHVGVRRRAVEIEVVLLDVLAVIPLRPRQAEEALLDRLVASVPQRQREADVLVAIADPGDAVFVPAIGARARLFVGEVVPGIAVRAVVFAHRAPRALGEVRAPALPVDGLLQAEPLVVHRLFDGIGCGPIRWRIVIMKPVIPLLAVLAGAGAISSADAARQLTNPVVVRAGDTVITGGFLFDSVRDTVVPNTGIVVRGGIFQSVGASLAGVDLTGATVVRLADTEYVLPGL